MGQHLAKNTVRRSKQQNEVRQAAARYMEAYDMSKTGTLDRDEVTKLTEHLLSTYTPLVGGLTDEDIDMIMRCSGPTVKTEITANELPQALSVMMAVRDMNKEYHEMFTEFDKDNTGELPADQLRALLASANGNVPPMASDVDFVLQQLEPRGQSDPIKEDQLKAALACWYSQHPPATDQIKTIFKSWDKAGNGVISKKEFVDAMLKLKPEFKQNQMELLFNQADKSETGVLDYQEFVDFIWSHGVDAKEEPVNASRPAAQHKSRFSTGGHTVVNPHSQGLAKPASPRPQGSSPRGENQGKFTTGGMLHPR